MSAVGGLSRGCICKGPRWERVKNWRVVLRNYELPMLFWDHWASQRYSNVHCEACGKTWRMKNHLAGGIPDAESATPAGDPNYRAR